MTATLARNATRTIAEVPAAAVAIAASFADQKDNRMRNVVIRPGEQEGTITILGASAPRAVEFTASGMASRCVVVPAAGLLWLTRRHPEAEMISIAQGEGAMISLRSFSTDSTVVTRVIEDQSDALAMPEFEPGNYRSESLHFNPMLLWHMLNNLRRATRMTVQPFAFGLIVKGEIEGASFRSFLAGISTKE